jgi:hypothetical protein
VKEYGNKRIDMQLKTIVLAAALSGLPGLLHAQFDFTVADKKVQIHSFGSQGFMYSDQNNYMSMPTSKGSFAFTDAGANISTNITDKFRVGAQIYLRNVGEFGNWHPEIDWAYGDYKFKNWFGFRAGKVKTTLGLFNEVQDMDSLHTFAVLPQAIYPIEWRSTLIAHTGGDLYGEIPVKHLGTFAYTAYSGMQPQDLRSGYDVAAAAVGVTYTYRTGRETGGDLRLTLPVGVVLGASYLDSDITGKGTYTAAGVTTPYHQDTTTNSLAQYYVQYSVKGFRLDAEYRKNIRDVNLFRTAVATKSSVDSRGWYVAGTYRVSKRFEISGYRSQYFVDTRKDTTPALAHEYDTAVAGRVDLNNHWYVKCEGHFIYGNPTTSSAARGFYAVANPAGIQPRTNLLVVRTGFSF